MDLRDLIEAVAEAELRGEGSPPIERLAYSTGNVGRGALFFCIRGFTADGHDHAPEAVRQGAVALVVERFLELDVPQVRVPDTRVAMAPIAARFNGDPTAELAVAGITGTNGKTTVAFLLRQMLEADGRRCGLLGTVKQVVGGVESEVERTTPEAIDLQATFAAMRDAGDQACAMEVSSHALTLHRADSIAFDCSVFTNLTQDHLDFHADMEDYFQAKRLLFAREGAVRIVNVDDPYGQRLAEEFGSVTYSVEGREASWRVHDVEFDAGGSRFGCDSPDGPLEVSTRLPGAFNVANSLAALASARELGVDGHVAVAALAGAERVPGRFEPIEEGQPFSVYVDYAHTPDSLLNVLRAARELTGGRLICVFGAGGDRDREKRPLMGSAAAELADLAIVTSDNPRSEDPDAIIGEILSGSGRDGVEVEPDRRAAIALAFTRAGEGDIVVIAGKGHEQGQELAGGVKVPFDDREVAREELRRATLGAGTG